MFSIVTEMHFGNILLSYVLFYKTTYVIFCSLPHCLMYLSVMPWRLYYALHRYNIHQFIESNVCFNFSPSEDESWPRDQSRSRHYLHHPPEEVNRPPPAQAPAPAPAPSSGAPGSGSNPSSFSNHSPQHPQAMVSRRAIISRSRDDLQHHLGVSNKNFTGEDQWFSKEKLYKVIGWLVFHKWYEFKSTEAIFFIINHSWIIGDDFADCVIVIVANYSKLTVPHIGTLIYILISLLIDTSSQLRIISFENDHFVKLSVHCALHSLNRYISVQI